MGLALIQYVQDYDELFPIQDPYTGIGAGCYLRNTASEPFADGGFYRGGNCEVWANLILPYIKSTGVFSCPDANPLYGGGNPPLNYGINTYLGYYNYPNYWIYTSTPNFQYTSGAPMAKVAEPTRVIMVSEMGYQGTLYVAPATDSSNVYDALALPPDAAGDTDLGNNTRCGGKCSLLLTTHDTRKVSISAIAMATSSGPDESQVLQTVASPAGRIIGYTILRSERITPTGSSLQSDGPFFLITTCLDAGRTAVYVLPLVARVTMNRYRACVKLTLPSAHARIVCGR